MITLKELAKELHQHGYLDDRMESRKAFTEKRIEEQLYTGYLEQTENGYKISNTIKNFISLKNLISTIFNTGS